MRITKKEIEKSIDEAIIKCRPTIAQMHTLLDGWTHEEKATLIKYAFYDNPSEVGFYENLTKYDTNGEDLFEYEKNIFKRLNKTQQKNILGNLVGFNEEDYQRDPEPGYPNSHKGALEQKQVDLQEEQGYSSLVKRAFDRWTDGSYDKIQSYIKTGDYMESVIYDGYDDKVVGDAIREYIQNSVGLDTDTLMFRGGHWDIGMKVGEIGTIPVLNSLSYSRDSAYELGINMERDEDGNAPPNRYMIDVYVDKGFKGAMVNAPSLPSSRFPEHEYLIDKNTRYIVLDVDDEKKTAKIKLLPPK